MALRTLTPSATISGPDAVAGEDGDAQEQVWSCDGRSHGVGPLECGDGGVEREQKAELIDTVQ